MDPAESTDSPRRARWFMRAIGPVIGFLFGLSTAFIAGWFGPAGSLPAPSAWLFATISAGLGGLVGAAASLLVAFTQRRKSKEESRRAQERHGGELEKLRLECLELRTKLGMEIPPEPGVLQGKFEAALRVDWGHAETNIIRKKATHNFGGPRVVVVVSGKGGVGKTTIALGLSEYFSQSGRTLLVDFDLPNRGLTSMFSKSFESQKTDFVLDLIEVTAKHPSFLQLFPESRISKAKSNDKASPDPEIEYEDSLEVLQQAVYQRGKKKEKKLKWGHLPVAAQPPANSEAVPADSFARNSIKSSNVGFLPSVPPGKRLLGSDVYNASALEVFYFLRCLVEWAHDTQPTGTIVIDCHGAHDLFVVGAIHAATDLVVVTTPDPGSFDGTYDLLAYANHVITSRRLFQPSTLSLVINQVRPSQTQSVKSLVEFYTQNSEQLGGQPFNIETVPGDTDIAAASASYHFGQIAKSHLWAIIVSLGSKIEIRPDYVPEIGEIESNEGAKSGESVTNRAQSSSVVEADAERSEDSDEG